MKGLEANGVNLTECIIFIKGKTDEYLDRIRTSKSQVILSPMLQQFTKGLEDAGPTSDVVEEKLLT